LLAAALVAGSLVFYLRYQTKGAAGPRIALWASSVASCWPLLLVTLADPVLQLTVTSRQQPYLYVIFDGTESMAIEDELTAAERAAIEKAVGWKGPPRTAPASLPSSTPVSVESEATPPSRMDYVQALIRKEQDNLLERLAREKQVQIETFLFDGNTTSQLRKLPLAPGSRQRLDPNALGRPAHDEGAGDRAGLGGP
jgi:hypothetical protein